MHVHLVQRGSQHRPLEEPRRMSPSEPLHSLSRRVDPFHAKPWWPLPDSVPVSTIPVGTPPTAPAYIKAVTPFSGADAASAASCPTMLECLAMNQASPLTCAWPPLRAHWRIFRSLSAALSVLAVVGCTASTPINLPGFSHEVDDLNFLAGQAIRRVVLPPATGGSGALSYSLSPVVPGLTFDPDTRTLGGTPTVAGAYPMTYEARDKNRKTAKLKFTIAIEQPSAIGSIVSAVAVGNSAGVLRLSHVPEPSGGPVVVVSGNHALVSGGTVFLDVAPDPGVTVDKLLLSIDGERFG